MTDAEIRSLYGVRYFGPGESGVHFSGPRDSYTYTVYVGRHDIKVEKGDSLWWIDHLEDGQDWAHVRSGPHTFVPYSKAPIAVVIRGYTPEDASARIGNKGTVLPYVNGCSTRQVFPPARPGDPTLQHLLIPPFSAEQAHHIHSTVRVVYILRGRGVSVVGMDGMETRTELLPGMVCILDPMCPHHFETPQGEAIEVIPLHVWSSVAGEGGHVMRRGTHIVSGDGE